MWGGYNTVHTPYRQGCIGYNSVSQHKKKRVERKKTFRETVISKATFLLVGTKGSCRRRRFFCCFFLKVRTALVAKRRWGLKVPRSPPTNNEEPQQVCRGKAGRLSLSRLRLSRPHSQLSEILGAGFNRVH